MTGTSWISEDTYLSYSKAHRFSLFLVRWLFKVPEYFHVRDSTLSLTGINESFRTSTRGMLNYLQCGLKADRSGPGVLYYYTQRRMKVLVSS